MPHLTAQGHARRLGEAPKDRLLLLRSSGPAGCGPIAAGGDPQPVLLLRSATPLGDPVEVVPRPDLAPVLPRESRDDVHVLVVVPHGDPTDAAVVVPRSQPHAVHQVGRDVGPLHVAQDAVGRQPELRVLLRRRDDEVVHGPLLGADEGSEQGLLQLRDEPAEVPATPGDALRAPASPDRPSCRQ